MTIRPRAAAVLLLVTALLTASCSTSRSEGTSTPSIPASTSTPAPTTGELTIGLTYTPDIQFAPFYVAEANGYYADSGVDVTLRHHGQSESLFGALDAGEEDLVVAGGDEMLQARSEGVGITSVATLYQEYPVVLIAPGDSPITAPEDLPGHSVGIPGPFGETYFGLLAMLSAANLTEDEVDVQHIGFTQQAALSAGHVDSVVGFANNDAVKFDAAGLRVRIIDLVPGGVPLVGIGVGVADTAMADDDAAMAAVVAATLEGVRDVIADPEAAVELSAEHIPGLQDAGQRAGAVATLQATVPLYGDAGSVGHGDPEQWQAMAEFMADQGLLGVDVDGAEAMTNDLLPAG